MFTREVREAKNIAEKKRLFYVAMTRARDHLILSYVCGRNLPPKNSRAAWIATYLLPKENPSSSFTFVTDDNISVDISVVERRSSGHVVPDAAMSATRLPVDFQHIREKMDENRKIAGCKVSAIHLDHPDQDASCDISASVGYEVVLHGVFQGLDIPMLCKKYRLSEEIRVSLLRSYEAFLNSPLMQNVAEEFCELPFSVEISGKQFAGTIDRLVRYVDGSWRIIDYKTRSMMSVGVNELEDYRRQFSIYVAAVHQLFSVEASACIYFVQDGGIMEMSLDESKFPTLSDDR
jgi:ATP-dependent helicase/nuclease subunit A